jgi:hypothetical protein
VAQALTPLSPFINAFSGVSDFYVQQHTAAPVPIFADDLGTGDAATRAANEGSERVRVLAKIEFSAGKTPKDRRHHACFDALGCRPRTWCKKRPTPGGAEGWGGHARLMSELEGPFAGVWQQGLDLD